jgi:hypothetical protein
VLKTLHPHSPVSVHPHFGWLLVDEAAQACEPEADVPLSVVLPDREGPAASLPQVPPPPSSLSGVSLLLWASVF